MLHARVQAYGKTTVSGSPFKVKCMPPKADPENSTVTMMQEHAFIDDIVKAAIRTVDQFGESCPAEGGVAAQVLDAQTEKVLFDARIVETGNVRPPYHIPAVLASYAHLRITFLAPTVQCTLEPSCSIKTSAMAVIRTPCYLSWYSVCVLGD